MEESKESSLADRIRSLHIPNPPDELGPTDDPASQYRFGYNTALEDVLDSMSGEAD